MQTVSINKVQYEILENINSCFSVEEIEEKLTDYFDDFDYIFGDFSYDKVRLKGFYNSNNEKVKNINDIKILNEYKKNYCSYGCRYFLLKKVK